MHRLKKLLSYFTAFEKALWLSSVSLITLSFILFDGSNYITLCASVLGTTSLIFCAKGNPFGQLLMIVFSTIYGYISWTHSYYGELITYVGMTLPMAVFALFAWKNNPYDGNRSEVRVHRLKRTEVLSMCGLTVLVTFVFYHVLAYFNTANLFPSTLSVTTSFVAAYLTYRRSPFFALAYAVNDVVLIVLWLLAGVTDARCISVVVCFIAFLVNDLYGFFSWQRMQKRQSRPAKQLQ